MNLIQFVIVAFVGLIGVILADKTDYSYWRPEDATNFDEVAYQSLQSIPHEKQDTVNPIANAIGKFANGIQNRQFAAGIAPVSEVFKSIRERSERIYSLLWHIKLA